MSLAQARRANPPGPDAAPCALLEWDSEFFGFRVARVRGSTLDRDSAAAIDAWCAQHEVRCLYLLLGADDEESASVADANRYRPVDVRLTLRHDLNPPPEPDPEAPIREAGPQDVPALSELAAQSHRDSRFYHDEGFPRERCDALYATWVADAVRDPARWVGVREVAGTAVGYEVVRPPGDEGIAIMEILAVDESHRRQGIGRNLLAAGLGWGQAAGASAVETATQERNRASLQAHLALGFVCTRREAWRHKWFGR
jgi:dTDP-4-amino-4,6-dideoxy-D-galactose acyltransferase